MAANKLRQFERSEAARMKREEDARIKQVGPSQWGDAGFLGRVWGRKLAGFQMTLQQCLCQMFRFSKVFKLLKRVFGLFRPSNSSPARL